MLPVTVPVNLAFNLIELVIVTRFRINKKTKWLIYTVLVGLIPFLSRLTIFIVSNNRDLDFLINAADFVAFGLVLQISNINELEHLDSEEKDWKTIQIGTSIVFIAIYSLLFSLTLISTGNPNSGFDEWSIKWCTIALSTVSFLLSYSVYDRVSKIKMRA